MFSILQTEANTEVSGGIVLAGDKTVNPSIFD
jgi:hypothetical protein